MKTTKSMRKLASRAKLSIAIVLGVLIVAALVWAWFALSGKPQATQSNTTNYAQEAAKPLEDGLVKAGGIKQCSRGDAGRSSDNDAPNYMALYEVPVDRDGAVKLLENVAKANGYDLYDNSASINAGDNKLYTDRANKPSPYSDLEGGSIVLQTTVFGSSTHTEKDDRFCTVTKRDNAPSDKTTIDISVGLPSFKR